MKKKTQSAAFCADQIDVITNFAAIKNVVLKRVHYNTRITINNNAPHLKSPKNQNRRAALGRSAMKLLVGFN